MASYGQQPADVDVADRDAARDPDLAWRRVGGSVGGGSVGGGSVVGGCVVVCAARRRRRRSRRRANAAEKPSSAQAASSPIQIVRAPVLTSSV